MFNDSQSTPRFTEDVRPYIRFPRCRQTLYDESTHLLLSIPQPSEVISKNFEDESLPYSVKVKEK